MRVAIKPDLAGERKAQFLISWFNAAFSYLLLLSADRCCLMMLPSASCCLALFGNACCDLLLSAYWCPLAASCPAFRYFWLLLAATSCHWLPLAAAACWLLLVAAGCCWLLLAAVVCCWRLLAAAGGCKLPRDCAHDSYLVAEALKIDHL